jgi:hypothetical protein
MPKPRPKDFRYYMGRKYDGMMGRCYREKDHGYKNYGGRGIRICSAWIKDIRSYEEWFTRELLKHATVEDFLKYPKDFQVDRIDNNGHYEPSNCRVVSAQENNRNKRSRQRRVIVSSEGEEICI